ncbi:MAG TPA: carboxy terminal-processing peptidase [Gemmataceae bacterium]|jgi:carboxyl-terminal processing protease|nr:carboxy terminal-processing peptidase [Gemmataceae bacterium]
MTPRILPHKYRAALAALVLLLVPFWLSAEPVPGKDDRVVAQMVCAMLQEGHVTRPMIDDEISRRLFQRFFKELDAGKLYFLKSDIDEFKRYETELDDMLLKGDVSFAYKVYKRFEDRIDQRLKLIDELVDVKYDFTKKEYLDTDLTHGTYAANAQELRERWSKRIKFDLLRERLGTKPPTDAEARQKVRERYHGFGRRMKQLDNYDLLELYLSALAASLDPHGAYMSPNTLDDFEISMRLRLEGIGALLRSENGQTIILETVPGGAAAKDGRLKPNDKIIAVAQGDGKFVDVVDMRLRDAVKLIRGPKGTKVELKVVPAGKLEPVIYTLTRQQIEIKSQAARSEIIEDGQKAGGKPYRIGVIELPSFYAATPGKETGEIKSASKDVRRILNEFKSQGIDGVILDMRNNPGGFLGEAVALAGLFIDQGPVVQVKDPSAGIQRLDDPDKGVVYAGPLVVLVNRGSASASEIVAATLQDYGRALIVGDSATHGKGTVQAVIDLGDQLPRPRPGKLGALRLTMQQFYRVNGDSTQNRGVLSDIVVPSLMEYLATPEKDMEYALAFDRVKPAEHQQVGMVPAELKAVLKARSAERIQASKDFAKLAKDIDRVKTMRQRKQVPLSESELKEQMNKEEADKLDEDALPEPKTDEAVYKFPRNFTTNEYLKIMEDVIQGRKLLPAQGRRRDERREAVAVGFMIHEAYARGR